MTRPAFSSGNVVLATLTQRFQSSRSTNQCCFLTCVVAPILALFAASASAGELKDKLAVVCKAQKVPGIIAASIGPDGLIESAAAGVRKRGATEAVSTGDQFAIGSNSKSFTSTLAAVLIEDGVIKWSTTISEVWPDQPVNRGFRNVTLEQLLAHSGGLQADFRRTFQTRAANGPVSLPNDTSRSRNGLECASYC